MPAAQLRSAEATGRRLAFQLWVCSILCWWGLGIPSSKLSGIELHDRLARDRPDLFRRLIVMTGDVASPEAADLLARSDRPVIEKPFELAELARVIGGVVG